ncbi:MAG: polymorphic toxin-type HINT domain-containing protein [Isosphaeraceae bacterium]
MFHATVLFAGLLVALVGDAPDSSKDLRTYEALKAKAGKDSQAQVKLALWCEAHGLNSERMKHLAQAMLSDPRNVTARGLLGLVAFGGRWESADKIGERVKADEQRTAKLAEYEGRRAKLADKEASIKKAEERYKVGGHPEAAYAVRLKGNHDLAQVHARLGLWCEQNGLKPEAIAHFTTAVHLDPSRDSSWRHLGCVKHNGRWMSPEQAATDDRDEHEQRLANRRWEPLLRKWKTWLGDPAASSSHRAEADEQLASVTDPRAVPSILKVFSMGGSESEQTRLLQLLGQIDAPKSSRAVANLAVSTRSEAVRTAAIELLKKRPRRDYAGQLVEMIRGKIHHTVIPVTGPGSTGALVLDTPRIHMVLTYETPAVFQPAASFRGYAGYDANGLPVIIQGRELERQIIGPTKLHEIEMRTAGLIAMANVKARVVQQRMAADLNEVEMVNEQAEQNNTRITPVLEVAAGAPPDLKDDEEAWHVWWYDKLGYSYQSPPQVTLVQDASPSQLPPPYITTCFVAGTPVRTLDGPRPIEAIQVGDQVLGQDATTGALGFHPVVFLHHNPPGKTLRVSLSNGDSLVCSVYHRFWRANLGWAMARELKPGDTLRTLGGLVHVAKVEADTIRPLYNLDVSGPRSFFVGTSHVLVHDNTLPDHRLKPFDALPVVEAAPPSE